MVYGPVEARKLEIIEKSIKEEVMAVERRELPKMKKELHKIEKEIKTLEKKL